MDKKELACVILRAQDLREMSWDGKGYKMSFEECAYKALGLNDDLDMCYIISSLISLNWNGIMEWAKTNCK